MKLSILFSTIQHLKIKQVIYQLKYRLIRRKFSELSCPCDVQYLNWISYIPKYQSCCGNVFTFLNQSSSFSSWNDTSKGMLWAYNLNYMDWLLQEDMDYEQGKWWIDKFIDDLPENQIGCDPYPIALRGINWIKFISMNEAKIDSERKKRWNNSLYSQYQLLRQKLEYHLLGNHLLEDAYSLYIAAIYFNDAAMYSKARKLLFKELKEQILDDGAHYEQSPMYHCILLERLLDCYNIAYNNMRFSDQGHDVDVLKTYCIRMLGHLESILYNDRSIPFVNDTAEGICSNPDEIFKYAERLHLNWHATTLKESGYRKMKNSRMEALVDVGDITADYQAGHSHADALNYELKVDNKPFIVDTGISTYDKTARRQYERSTEAHNCVVVGGNSSSEVWGGFRVGKRCNVKILIEDADCIEAYHDGYDKHCSRKFQMQEDAFLIEDRYKGDAISYIHLSHEADIEKIIIEGAHKIEVINTKYSTRYNRFIDNKTIRIHFNGKVNYRIQC